MADLVRCVKDIGNCILTQCIQPPVKRHFDYWWCFDDNIQGLGAGIEELKGQKHYIEQSSEEARLRTHILCHGVDQWLKASTEKLEEAQKILLPDHNIPKAWNITSRYSMGKRAKETAKEIAKLLNDGNFNPIAYPAPPAAMGSPFHRLTVDFESRKSIEKNIFDSLKKSSVDMIGICGMGGLGKTTMAQRIGKRVKEENLFDEIVMATVSQTMDMAKIQNEIAELLGLKFDVESISARAHKLRTRLMDAKRKIIILDDVWESVRFEDLGIPIECNFGRCKVVLTSRSRDTCKTIKNTVVFDLKVLEEEEAWILFKEKAGNCVEDSTLCRVAKDVAAECKGLPIALVTVSMALQNVTSIHKWEDSLLQLRRGNPANFQEVLLDVYNPLKLSYDYLDTDNEKYLFLLCCLFPEDHNISVEQLTWCSLGLRLFDDITNIKEIRNRTHSLVEKLKSRFLLIAGFDNLHVKMHDVVRDVAIYIGSRKNHGVLKSLHSSSIENPCDVNCNWMSVDISNEQMEVPVLSRFPKLRLLMLLPLKFSYKVFYDISHISFEGMEDLNVLSFQSISIPSLPPTLGSLENLQTLRLFDCEVQNISVIGKLTSLKILSCRQCKNITELPAEIGRLKGLRLLELYNCNELQRIPFGIISSLSLLEELKIRFSFSEWETGGERRNASLTELERLRNLTCLEIEMSDCILSAQEIRLSQKLVRYRICNASEYYYDIENRNYEKVMILNLSGAVGNWIQLLARNAEFLSLRGDGSDNINLAEMENLRVLSFNECSTVKKLVDTSYLIQNVSLCNLKGIYIYHCSNLKHVFPVSVARTRLLQLEALLICNCESMEQVFWNEVRGDNTDDCIEFPKLKELILGNLPNLTAFCQGRENMTIKFPNLTRMNIEGLPKLINLSPHPKDLLQLESLRIVNCESMEQVFWNEVREDNTDDCIEFPKLKELILWNLPNLTAFCQGLENMTIKFPNLTRMDIEGLPKLISLSPPNSETVENTCFHLFCNPKDLLQLEIIHIENCESMEQVFWNEVRDDNTDDCIEFPKLKTLRLANLPNLTAFCQGLENIIIKFPNLTEMRIRGLPKLISLSPLNSETVENTCFHLFCNPKDLLQLESLGIVKCESMEQVFLNEIKDNNTYDCIEFPRLKTLTLWDLPNLTSFWQGLENITIKFPNLIEMYIGGLPKLNSLSPLNSETVENTCFHLFCYPKVEMGLLKNLRLSTFEDNIKNIWCSQIPNNVFNNIEELYIDCMNGIRRLMSSSIAKKLVSLRRLTIIDCRDMVEVIETNDGNDKQVVDINCLFPNLSHLKLENLHKLIRFWQWNHTLELPLLAQMNINNCPAMETFTLGSINTPNIREIIVNLKNIEDHKDLNDVIRNI